MKDQDHKIITDYEDPDQYSSKKTIKMYKIALIVISIAAVGLIATFTFQAYQVSKIDPF